MNEDFTSAVAAIELTANKEPATLVMVVLERWMDLSDITIDAGAEVLAHRLPDLKAEDARVLAREVFTRMLLEIRSP